MVIAMGAVLSNLFTPYGRSCRRFQYFRIRPYRTVLATRATAIGREPGPIATKQVLVTVVTLPYVVIDRFEVFLKLLTGV